MEIIITLYYFYRKLRIHIQDMFLFLLFILHEQIPHYFINLFIFIIMLTILILYR